MVIANADVSIYSCTVQYPKKKYIFMFLALHVYFSWKLLEANKELRLTDLIPQGVQEAERPEEGFYIRSGITVIQKNATIRDGMVI